MITTPDTPKIPEVTTIGIFENPDYTRSMRIDTLRHRFGWRKTK